MKPFLKAMAVALPLAVGALVSGSAVFAQEQAMPSAEPQALADRRHMLTDVLARTLPASRAPEIYADLRYALGELYLPYMSEVLSNREASGLDPETLEKFAVMVPLLDYALRAARELEPVFAGHRDALIADMASLQAKYISEEEIRFISELLDTPATRKGFNTMYALSRLMTGYTQEDMRSSKEMSAWLKDWKFNFSDNPLAPKDTTPPPSPGKVAKAQAVVMDFMRVARVDDMVSDIVAFAKNVVLEVQALKPDEREAVHMGLAQFQFYYNLGKSMAIAVAPSGLATALTDDQLAKFHVMMLSPVMAKSFNHLYSAVREATSFTKHDVEEFRQIVERGENAKQKWKHNPETEARLNAEWEALGDRWRERLMNSLPPDTRQGLETSLAAFQALIEAEEAKRAAEGGDNGNGEADEDATEPQPRKL